MFHGEAQLTKPDNYCYSALLYGQSWSDSIATVSHPFICHTSAFIFRVFLGCDSSAPTVLVQTLLLIFKNAHIVQRVTPYANRMNGKRNARSYSNC